MNNRQIWVDMLKGYGIIVVTLGHAGVDFLIEKHIYSYHMFLFFFISGYLFTGKRNLKETLCHKTNTILIPFIAWDVISSVIGAVINNLSFKSFISTLFILKGNLCFNAPIWFLLVLFFTEIIYVAVKKYATDWMIVVTSVLLFVMVGTIKLPLKINLIPLALFSYALGDLYKMYKNRGGYKQNLLLLQLALCSITFGMFLNERISYTAGIFGNMFYCIVAAITGVMFFCILFQWLFEKSKYNFLCYLGRNSFSIMVMQYYFFRFYNPIAKRLFGIEDLWHTENTLKAVFMSAVTIGLILIIVELCRNCTSGKFKKVAKFLGI